jgi:PAS domain S-box-containing protein
VGPGEDEDKLLHSTALRNAQSILLARQRAEQELVAAKDALEHKARELDRSLAMMRATLEAATDGMLVTDRDGHVTNCNQRYVELWQIPLDIMESRQHRRLLEHCSRQFADPAPFIARVEEIYASSPPETFDLLELADGRMLERFSRIQFVDGQNAGRVWSFSDITERKRSQETRFRLAAIVESSDDAIVSKTLDGIITTWNEGARRIFGYAAEEIVGKSVLVLFPPDRVDEELVICEKLRRGERLEHYETIRVRKDGTLLNVSLTVSPVKDAEGKVIGASKIARDITDRIRSEEKLRDETRVLELLNSTGRLIASQLDLQSLVQSVTDAATQLSGAKFGAFFYNVIDQKGESFLLYTLSGAPRAAFEDFGLPRNTPVFNPTFRGEGVLRSPDITKDPRYGTMSPHHGMPKGHLPVRSYLAAPVVSRSGIVIGGLFFGHPDPDIFTERAERIIAGVAAQAAVAIDNARLYEDVRRAADDRKHLLDAERAARAEAERVSLMKDEFLATLSHELRTPLNAILGWSQLLRTRTREDEELEEGLAVIERNTRVQTQLIEDLLDMSRIISGKIRLDVQRVDLQDVVRAAVASVRLSAEAKEIRLQVVLDPVAGPVRGDPNRLQQCFWNLLSNAIKFTPKGGKVQVSLQRVDSHLEVCVADDGQGIKAEFLPHVFERFRQADASTTRRHGGLGLGLSIVKHLVELHGGTVNAKSAGEGKGATFCIELPLMVMQSFESDSPRAHPRGVTSPSNPQDHPSLQGVSVQSDSPRVGGLWGNRLRRGLVAGRTCDPAAGTARHDHQRYRYAGRRRL